MFSWFCVCICAYPLHADQGETVVSVEAGAGFGGVSSPRTQLSTFGLAPVAHVGASVRQGLTNHLGLGLGLTFDGFFFATNPGAAITLESDGGRTVEGDLRSDVFVVTAPLHIEYAFDLGADIFGLAIADVYLAGAAGPSFGVYQNNFLLVPGDASQALLSPGQIPPDVVFGGQGSLSVGARARALDLVLFDLEVRGTVGFVGAPHFYGAVVVRPAIGFYPFSIF